MKIVTTITAAALVAAASNAFAASGILEGKGKAKPLEVVEKAAGDGPKQYNVRAALECKADRCVADFGLKDERTRELRFINCGVTTKKGIARVGAVALDDVDNQLGYFSTVSRATEDATETAVLEYKNPVTVPQRRRAVIVIAVTGKATGGQCTAGGTIE